MKNKLSLTIWLCFIVSVVILFHSHRAFAYVNTTPIDSGYNSVIIPDAVFTNTGSMSYGDVHNFLNSQVATCDTWHPNTIGGGESPPWTCLKDYRDGMAPYKDPDSGNAKAAYIIWKEATDNGLNPQDIIVTLQKENSLITDSWPFASQYRTAMGYGCPDGGDCNADYYGFYNQVHLGSKLLREAFDRSCGNMSSYPGWGDIAYGLHLGRSQVIDGRSTYIGSCATGSLYNYTPHRPDSAWLTAANDGNYYYGNYNFINYFNKWFAYGEYLKSHVPVSNLVLSDTNPAIGETITVSYTLTNNTAAPIALGTIGIVGRFNGQNRDIGWTSYTLNTSEAKNFSFTTVVGDLGIMTYAPAFLYQGSWVVFNQVGFGTRYPHLSVQSAVNNTPTSPVTGQSTTIQTTVVNSEGFSLAYSALGLVVRLNGGGNYDTSWNSNGVIGGNSTKTLIGAVNCNLPGSYTATPAYSYNGVWMSVSTISGANASRTWLVGSLSSNNVPVSNLVLSDTNPAIGETITVSYTLTNNTAAPIALGTIGIVGRFNGQNRDIGWTSYTLNTSEAKNFSFTTVVGDLGIMTYAPAFLYQGSWVVFNQVGFGTRYPHLSVQSAVNNTPTSPVTGQSTTIQTTVVNSEGFSLAYSALGLVVRLNGGGNYDTSWNSNGVIGGNSTKTLIGAVNCNLPGSYTATPAYSYNGVWMSVSTISGANASRTWLVGSLSSNNVPVSNLVLSDTNPAIGETITVSYTLTNNTAAPIALGTIGIVGRFNGQNRDIGWTSYTLNTSEAKNFSFTTVVGDLGIMTYAPAFLYQGSWVVFNQVGFGTRYPHLSVQSAAVLSDTGHVVGQTATLQATITNIENFPLLYSALGIAVRLNGTVNYDTAWSRDGFISANSSKSISGSFIYSGAGTYEAKPVFSYNNNWYVIPLLGGNSASSWIVTAN